MKAHGLLPIRKKGKDSKKPSMRPIRTPLGPAGRSPPRSRVANLPSSGQNISASLEGSEPTLKRYPQAGRIISASLEATPRRKRQAAFPFTRPSYGGIKCQPFLQSAQDRRPPFPIVAVTGVPSANSGHCSAIPDVVAALWNLRRGTRQARHCSRYYSANSGCPDSTSSHVWSRTRPLIGKGSGVATSPSKRDAHH